MSRCMACDKILSRSDLAKDRKQELCDRCLSAIPLLDDSPGITEEITAWDKDFGQDGLEDDAFESDSEKEADSSLDVPGDEDE